MLQHVASRERDSSWSCSILLRTMHCLIGIDGSRLLRWRERGHRITVSCIKRRRVAVNLTRTAGLAAYKCLLPLSWGDLVVRGLLNLLRLGRGRGNMLSARRVAHNRVPMCRMRLSRLR